MPSYPVLILGYSGSGKSSAIRTLDPNETFLISITNKPLPFKENKHYKLYDKNNCQNGNKVVSTDYQLINQAIEYVNNKRPEINHLIIDDSHYLIINEFMAHHSAKAKMNDKYDIYNRIADSFYDLTWSSQWLRDDLFIYFMHRAETGDDGFIKPKTVGKILDNQIDIPGMFTLVIYCKMEHNGSFFYVKNQGESPAKTPIGMFDEDKIPNDLSLLSSTVLNYYKGDL
jgi:hypothetical protein